MQIKDIVIIGMMSAILVAVQVTLGFLPNVELVSLLIILYTCIFRWKCLYIIYVFVMVEGMIYGIGLWWFNYLYVWTVLFLIAMIFRTKRDPLFWAIISGSFGLGFGTLCSIPYFITGWIATGFAYWVSGIPFDITHGISNFAIALVLFYPLRLLLDIVNRRTEHST